MLSSMSEIDRTAAPLVLFAHGAGAPSSSRWMQAWADRLRAVGPVAPFDYPYMKNGRKTPDRLPVLLEAHRQALAEAREEHGRHRPVVLAGKSMGSRIGCHLAVTLADEAATAGASPVAAVICFGYPLRAAGSGASRAEVLQALRTPILFLQGSRDPLGPLDDLAAVRTQMTAPNDLFVVDGGDHSLEIRKRAAAAAGQTQAGWDAGILVAIDTFLRAQGLQPASRPAPAPTPVVGGPA
jgi:predicted alpha/beta-hydrolase family hydrolase